MRKHIFIGISVIILAFILLGVLVTNEGLTVGGNIKDSSVTSTCVNDLSEEIQSRIDVVENKLEDLSQQLGSGDNDGDPIANGFKVIKIDKGQFLYGDESTEIILRAGIAKVIANKAGDGLTDITEGIDLKNETIVEKNHLIIVPRTDNRGLKMDSKGYIMVKGSYRIE